VKQTWSKVKTTVAQTFDPVSVTILGWEEAQSTIPDKVAPKERDGGKQPISRAA
jgi:hypothetical protein